MEFIFVNKQSRAKKGEPLKTTGGRNDPAVWDRTQATRYPYPVVALKGNTTYTLGRTLT